MTNPAAVMQRFVTQAVLVDEACLKPVLTLNTELPSVEVT
jgi:hypothetical protein